MAFSTNDRSNGKNSVSKSEYRREGISTAPAPVSISTDSVFGNAPASRPPTTSPVRAGFAAIVAWERAALAGDKYKPSV